MKPAQSTQALMLNTSSTSSLADAETESMGHPGLTQCHDIVIELQEPLQELLGQAGLFESRTGGLCTRAPSARLADST